VGQERLGPSYFFISLVLGPLNSLLWYVPSSRYICVNMELGSYFLFLQEQIKDIIIMATCVVMNDVTMSTKSKGSRKTLTDELFVDIVTSFMTTHVAMMMMSFIRPEMFSGIGALPEPATVVTVTLDVMFFLLRSRIL
jgi:hypothetical protein